MKNLLLILFILFSLCIVSGESINDTIKGNIEQTLSRNMNNDSTVIDTQLLENIFTAKDVPNDAGGAITIEWKDTIALKGSFVDIYRIDKDSTYTIASELPFSLLQYSDANSDENKEQIKDNKEYYYFLIFNKDNEIYKSNKIGPVIAKASWFNKSRANSLIIIIIISLVFMWYIGEAKKGKNLYIRKIAGLDAVEEAVGRSTEMGKPIMYILGIGYVTDIPTIAGLTILGRVAKKAAEYDTRIMVPSYDPIVMTTAQEVVKEAFTEAGRPDTYRKQDIMYLTQDQFGYAAGVDGMMLREKPGAIFLQGLFFAESLILAETGHSIGAIQIAGTTETAQLPFFVAACDYTLIGEEMMAASVYLQKEPLMLGSLVAEDFLKILIIIIVLIGFIVGILGPGLSIDIFNNIFNWLTSVL